jgi:pimeloyl-ACP methyl ester carboxylesterase
LEHLEQRLVGQPQISAPTIVLHGEGDAVHPPSSSEGQENLFSAYYERQLIPVAGHLFPREAPDAVIAAVRRLSRHLGNDPQITPGLAGDASQL